MDKFNLIAYLLWLIGGWVGLHHFYMGRDRQGVLWLTSFGGLFGLGKQSVPLVVYRTQCYRRSSTLVNQLLVNVVQCKVGVVTCSVLKLLYMYM